MSGTMTHLPAGFEVLEPFVSDWAISGADNRARRRLSSTEEERQAFFAAAANLLAPALLYLDNKRLGEFDDKDERLMDLMLSFAHVALAIELQGDHENKHRLASRHLRITQAPSDKQA